MLFSAPLHIYMYAYIKITFANHFQNDTDIKYKLKYQIQVIQQHSPSLTKKLKNLLARLRRNLHICNLR
jgi:hypothetical protein